MSKGKIFKRLRVLEQEIVMGSYYDGWTLKGLKKEYKELHVKLLNILNRKKDI